MEEFQPAAPRVVGCRVPHSPHLPTPPAPLPTALDVTSRFLYHSRIQGDSGGQFLVSLSPLSWGSLGQVPIF